MSSKVADADRYLKTQQQENDTLTITNNNNNNNKHPITVADWTTGSVANSSCCGSLVEKKGRVKQEQRLWHVSLCVCLSICLSVCGMTPPLPRTGHIWKTTQLHTFRLVAKSSQEKTNTRRDSSGESWSKVNLSGGGLRPPPGGHGRGLHPVDRRSVGNIVCRNERS